MPSRLPYLGGTPAAPAASTASSPVLSSVAPPHTQAGHQSSYGPPPLSINLRRPRRFRVAVAAPAAPVYLTTGHWTGNDRPATRDRRRDRIPPGVPSRHEKREFPPHWRRTRPSEPPWNRSTTGGTLPPERNPVPGGAAQQKQGQDQASHVHRCASGYQSPQRGVRNLRIERRVRRSLRRSGRHEG